MSGEYSTNCLTMKSYTHTLSMGPFVTHTHTRTYFSMYIKLIMYKINYLIREEGPESHTERRKRRVTPLYKSSEVLL